MGTSEFWYYKDVTIHYHSEGQGPPFFLVHGYSSTLDWRVWELTIPLLATEHKVYALDMVGHGKSTKIDPKPSNETQANFLVEMIQEKGFSDCSLAGVSWGALICQLVASKIPELITRLVLISSAGYRLTNDILEPTRDIPTLIIWSEDDSIIPLAKGKELAQKLPQAKFVVIPAIPGVSAEAAHHPQRNKASLTNPHIRAFLKEIQ
ncbi:MAG: alpha/beta fold hydrolase [Candidatus Hermodarchaeota archaeon]